MLKAGTAARRRTLRWNEPVDGATLKQGAEHFLRTLDSRLQEQEATWVGHCKLMLVGPEQTAYVSLTAAGDTLRWAGEPVATRSIEMTIYVALYNWTDADVARVLDAVLADEPFVAAAVTG